MNDQTLNSPQTAVTWHPSSPATSPLAHFACIGLNVKVGLSWNMLEGGDVGGRAWTSGGCCVCGLLGVCVYFTIISDMRSPKLFFIRTLIFWLNVRFSLVSYKSGTNMLQQLYADVYPMSCRSLLSENQNKMVKMRILIFLHFPYKLTVGVKCIAPNIGNSKYMDIIKIKKSEINVREVCRA